MIVMPAEARTSTLLTSLRGAFPRFAWRVDPQAGGCSNPPDVIARIDLEGMDGLGIVLRVTGRQTRRGRVTWEATGHEQRGEVQVSLPRVVVASEVADRIFAGQHADPCNAQEAVGRVLHLLDNGFDSEVHDLPEGKKIPWDASMRSGLKSLAPRLMPHLTGTFEPGATQDYAIRVSLSDSHTSEARRLDGVELIYRGESIPAHGPGLEGRWEAALPVLGWRSTQNDVIPSQAWARLCTFLRSLHHSTGVLLGVVDPKGR